MCGVVAFNTYHLFGLGEEITGIKDKITLTEHQGPQESPAPGVQEFPDEQAPEENPTPAETPKEQLKFRIDVDGNNFNNVAILRTEYVLSAKCTHQNKHSKNECLKGYTPKFEVDGAKLTEDKFIVEDSTITEVRIKCTINDVTEKREIKVKK